MAKFESMIDELMVGYEDFSHADVILEGVTTKGSDEHTVRISLGVEDFKGESRVYVFNKKIISVDMHTPLDEELEETVLEERPLK